VGPRAAARRGSHLTSFDAPADLAPLLAEAERRLFPRPAAAGVDRWQAPPEAVVTALESASAPVLVAGPGVVLADAVPGLHALAAAGSLGVLNTWGAKGVFDWRSRHHLATVGLQALDFERGGLADADLVVATGIDEQEMLTDWRLAPVVEVAPEMLDPLAERWGRPRTEITVPPLRADLARVTQEGWEVASAPLPPTRVTRHYSTVLGGGGLVAADPGVAGYWVARTFGTTGVGGAQVPAGADAIGFSIAAALVAQLADPGRPVLAVVDQLGDVHRRLLEVAARLSVDISVEEWRDGGDALDADAHLARLEALTGRGGVVSIATDPRQLDRMIEVAGPIVAWTAG